MYSGLHILYASKWVGVEIPADGWLVWSQRSGWEWLPSAGMLSQIPPVKRSQLPRQSPEHSCFFIEQTAIRPSAADLTNWFGIPSDVPSLLCIPSAVNIERRWKNNCLYYRSCSSGKMIKGWVGKWTIRLGGQKINKYFRIIFFKCLLYWKCSRNAGDMGTNHGWWEKKKICFK